MAPARKVSKNAGAVEASGRSLRTRKNNVNYEDRDEEDDIVEDVKPVKMKKRGRKRKESSADDSEDFSVKKEKHDDTSSTPGGSESKKANGRPSLRARKSKINYADQDDGSDDDLEPAPASSNRKKRKEASSVITSDVTVKEEAAVAGDDTNSATSTTNEDKAELKKLKFSGAVPVDEYCAQCASDYHVYHDASSGDIFNAMLNQTNIGFNNNKYYFLQLLKHNTNPEYVVWFRWGRIGKVAGTTLKRHGSNFDAAKQEFEKKFRDKTQNHWADRDTFIKVQGKYDLLEMDYGEEDEEIKKKEDEMKRLKKETKKEVESKLDKRVADVIDLIFNITEMEAAVKEMEYDVKKAPLGKLTTKQIKAGYESLKKVEACQQKNEFGRKLVEACSEFYTRIPHDFGMRCPPLIRTPAELKTKIQLLEALSDIQIAIQMIKDEQEEELNPRDTHYNSLGCELEPFDSDHEEYTMVKNYVTNSHGSTHTQYNLEVDNVFKVVREEEEKRFQKDIGNRMLLWHGSRLTNWCGILKQGLRIAPPEAPVTGYMFGKGVYFADVVSKSANYCFASKRQPAGFLLLCEVALGNTCDKFGADYNADRLPSGVHSTKGVGSEVPAPEGNTTLACGTVVPLGKPKMETGNFTLRYNEYVVYDVSQVRARYLVKVNFKYNDLW